jgi:DnaK suppressor protein
MPDAELRALLEGRRAAALELLGRLDADERSLLRDRADATADDEHDPEGSTLSGEWSRVDALGRAARDELADVDAALARMDSGAYGVCEACGRSIPRERLLARPMARRCVACAR